MWNLAPCFVFNNMWNASNYTVSQTLYAFVQQLARGGDCEQ